jgi:hypothetical protein
MTIEFVTAYTKTPVVEFDWPVRDLQPLFDDYQEWQPNTNLKGGDYDGVDLRLCKKSDQFDKQSQSLNNFELALDSSKNQLVKKMLEIDTNYRWPDMPAQISNQLRVYVSLISDLKGYRMDPHIDNRSVYAAGYLNIFDNESLTVISTKKSSIFNLSKYRAPGKQGRGAIWLNTDNSWHWVNTVSKDRRIILFTFHLVMWD